MQRQEYGKTTEDTEIGAVGAEKVTTKGSKITKKAKSTEVTNPAPPIAAHPTEHPVKGWPVAENFFFALKSF